jgi:hypothetical protein
MSQLTELVHELKDALHDIEATPDHEQTPTVALEDFKSTIDSARTNVLAILTAADPGDYHGFVRQFRLRRAAQGCQSVLSGLVDGTVDAATPGLPELQATVDEALERLEQLEPKA